MFSIPQLHRPYFVIEGNIGAGKSTLLKIIRAYLNAQIVFEPYQEWQDISGENLLDMYYKDMSRWAYTFQTYAFITRVMKQQNDARSNHAPYQIIDRSVYSDRYCFAQNAYETGIMTDLEWNLYTDWFNWLVQERIQRPAGFIYLRVDPEICYKRIGKRMRQEENAITLEYLTLLYNRHEAWLVRKENVDESIKSVPVVILDGNEEFESNSAVQKQYIKKITEFLKFNYGIPLSDSLLSSVVL